MEFIDFENGLKEGKDFLEREAEGSNFKAGNISFIKVELQKCCRCGGETFEGMTDIMLHVNFFFYIKPST